MGGEGLKGQKVEILDIRLLRVYFESVVRAGVRAGGRACLGGWVGGWVGGWWVAWRAAGWAVGWVGACLLVILSIA